MMVHSSRRHRTAAPLLLFLLCAFTFVCGCRPASAQSGWFADLSLASDGSNYAKNATLTVTPPANLAEYWCTDCLYCATTPMYSYTVTGIRWRIRGDWTCTHGQHAHHFQEDDDHDVIWNLLHPIDSPLTYYAKVTNICCCTRVGTLDAVVEITRGPAQAVDCACLHSWVGEPPTTFLVVSNGKLLTTLPGDASQYVHRPYTIVDVPFGHDW
jgi:hypothetical protein